MQYLMKKMLRDLWNMKTQFIAVLLMSFFAVFVYTGMEGVWFGMTDYAQEWMKDRNTADAWIQGYQMDMDDVSKIQRLTDIDTVQPVCTLTAEMCFGDKDTQLLLMTSPESLISIPETMSGETYQPNGQGIWLYEAFALEHEISVGDIIKVEYGERNIRLKVRGLVLSPEYLSYTGSSVSIIPDHFQYGYGYLSQDGIEELAGHNLEYSQVKILYQKQWNNEKGEYIDISEEAIYDVRNDIEQELGNKYVGYYDGSDFKGISSFADKFYQLRSMTVLFAVVLILLAMLTIQTTMKRMIEIQKMQIGTLKALGYQNWKIRLHYLFYGFWVSLSGGVLGYILAPITISEMLLSLQKKFYSVPEWVVRNSPIALCLLAGIVLTCSVTALIASRKGTKDLPAITMREEPPKTHKPILLERFTSFWNMLSYEWRWTLRSIAKNKARTIIGIIGIIGSVALLIDSFGLSDSLKHANTKLYGTQFDYGAKITLKATATEENQSELYELANEDAQWLQESVIDIRTAKSRSNSILQIYDIGYFYHFEDADGFRVALPTDGVAISRKLAADMEIQENDSIKFRIAGQTDYVTAQVKYIIETATPQGIFTTASFWQTCNNEFYPNVLLVGDSTLAEDIINRNYVSEAITLEEQLEQSNEAMNSILMIVVMLMVGALLLSIIILYNLGILSFTENSREYATLKVIGYRENEIKAFIRHDNLVQLFVGLFFGVPLGYLLLNVHIGLASTDSFDYTAYLEPYNLLIILGIVVIVTVLISSIVSHKAIKLNMVEALKSTE